MKSFHYWCAGLVLMGAFFFSSCSEATEKEEKTEEIIDVTTVDSLSVNSPELIKEDANGELLLTAQKGKATGPAIKYMPEWLAFGWFGGEDKVEWDIETVSGGDFEVYIEWSVSDEDAGKDFIVEAKDEAITGKVKSTGSWEIFNSEKIGNIKLIEGSQTVIFRPTEVFEKGALLDLRQLKMVRIK